MNDVVNMATKTIKVLAVEDDKSYAQLILRMLMKVEEISFDVRVAGDLQAAMGCLAEEASDVILLDLNLPDSQGLDTLDKMHALVPEIPILV